MGSSASVECSERSSSPVSAKELVNSILCKNEVEKKFAKLCEYEDRMCKIFCHDEKMRKLFIKYIKLGSWMDKFREGPENTLIMILLSKVQQNALNLRPFNPAEDGIAMQSSFSKPSPSTRSEISVSLPPLLSLTTKMNTPTKSCDSMTESARSQDSRSHNRSSSSMYRSSSSMVSNGGNFFEDSIREPGAPLELLSLLFASLYPLFVESRMFKAHYPPRSLLDKVGSIVQIKSADSADYFSGSGDNFESNRKEGTGHALSLFLKAANTYDETDLVKMLSTPIWLERHRPSALIDHAPISISIASATQGPGFPLVYVNKAFERLTGYSAREILGESCKILQGEETAEKHILRMNEALQGQRATKIEVVNYTKQGRAFHNLLILTPVFDHVENLAYVIGVQFDVTDHDVTAKEIHMAKDILAMLPYLLNL